ncbi:MAG: SusC/RagA family TonB-linked outer membrane protein [Gemmatimonadetes bacterium]|nr:SusC/RagA family TonB-linked outer membrane protein [Gemmatimonadota bacterium]
MRSVSRSALLRRAAGAAILVVIAAAPVRARPHLAASVADEPQTGTVTGRVVDGITLQPLSAVQVYISRLDMGSLTGANGRFILLNVPAGTHELRFERIGYRSVVQEVVVRDGQTTEVSVALREEALALDEIVVTGTAGGTQRRAVGNAVAKIQTPDIVATAPVGDLSQLLNARSPGVTIRPPGGQASAGARIVIRGRSSISLSTDPLIYVDGVRVNNQFPTGGTQFGAVSRLDDFSPRDIESIEIIKGPAAATLYGTEASNGVIQIITKKGLPGRTTVGVTTRQGVTFQWNPEMNWPLMWVRGGQLPAPEEPGVSIVDKTQGIWTFNIIKAEQDRGTPIFRTGHLQGYGVNVSGGSDVLRYYVAADYDRVEGSLRPDKKDRFGGRLNLSIAPHRTVDLSTQLGLTLSSADIPPAQLKRHMLLNRPATRNSPSRGFLSAPHDVWASSQFLTENLVRFTGGFEIRHRPLSWLSHRLQTGVDVSDQEDTDLVPKLGPENAQFFSTSFAAGAKAVDLTDVLTTTVDYSATATLPVREGLESSSTAGFQYYRSLRKIFSQQGREFPSSDVTSIAGAAIRLGSQDEVENVTVGLFVQEQLGWKNRLFLTGAIRFDDNSAFGESFELVSYPKVSGSWVISEEPFWNVSFVDALRLRAAYGQSGLQPEAFAALRTFEPITGKGGQPAVTPQFVGNSELGPERAREIEVGFEASLLQQRARVDFTYYYQRTKDAIVLRDIAPSGGFYRQQFVNIGEIENQGVELQVNGRAVERSGLALDLAFNLATNANKILDVGIEGVDFLTTGSALSRHQEGYPVSGFFTRRVVSAERGPDGKPINILCDGGPGKPPVPCAQAPSVYRGRPEPNVEGSLNTTVTLLDRLSVSGLVDFKLGNKTWMSHLWCPGGLACEDEVLPERFDPVYAASSFLSYTDEARWVMDQSFGKLREVSLRYMFPESWMRRFGASRASVSVAARNLHTWAPSELLGLDPENVGGFALRGRGNVSAQNEIPTPTQWVTTLNLTF